MSVTLTAARGPAQGEKLAYLAYQIRRSPLTMAGLLITSIVLLCMIFAPWLASHDPNCTEPRRTPGAAIRRPLVRHR
jgi:peptide/nickel transport system permease protein